MSVSRKRQSFIAGLLILQLSIVSAVSAAQRQYLKKNETFCDSSGVLCLHGSLTFLVNSSIISLRARVQKQTGPGVIKIVLTGSNRQDFFRRTEFEITIRGKHSEIINYQMGPDAPDVYQWSLASFDFVPNKT
jgi:hypothetical protein